MDLKRYSCRKNLMAVLQAKFKKVDLKLEVEAEDELTGMGRLSRMEAAADNKGGGRRARHNGA